MAAAAAIAYSLLYTRVIGLTYRVVHDHGLYYGYRTPTDFWCMAKEAGYVANGALGYVYEACQTSPALPLGAIMLAPAVAVGQAHGLTGPPSPAPSMWLLLGPVAMLSAVPLLLAVLAPRGLRLGRALPLLLGAALLAFAPMGALYGHVEDVMALALVLWAIGPARAGRWLPAALLLGLAMASKQWVLLAVPAMLAAMPGGWRVRLRALAAAAVIPGALAALTIAADPAHALPVLAHPPTFPEYGQPAPWVDLRLSEVGTTPFRLATIAIACLLGLRLHAALRTRAGERERLGLLLGALGLALLARALLEPVLHAYYLGPGLCLLLLHERHTSGRLRRTLAVGGTLLLWCSWHGDQALWWSVALPLAGIVAAPAAFELAGVQLRRPDGDVTHRRQLGEGVGHMAVTDRQGGFTLIELMVVILIIAILIAIAIPIFLGARQRAQDAAAQSSLAYALKAEHSHYADAESYTADTTALDNELQASITLTTGTPAGTGKEVSVTVDDIGAGASQQDQLVCLVAISASGSTFTLKDMAKGSDAGTWYLRGAASDGCSTDVTGYARSWSG